MLPAPFARRFGSGVFTPPMGGDPYWANVSLLLPMTGADGSTTFTDVSAAGRAFTAVGDAQIDTAFDKWGTGSGLFDGTGDRLTTPSTGLSPFMFGTADWTIEVWTRRTATKANAFVCSTTTDASANGGWWLDFGGNAQLYYAGTLYLNATGAPADSAWHFTSVSVVSGSGYVHVDGVLATSSPGMPNITLASNFRVGGTEFNGGFNLDFNGHMQDLRITTGVGRYGASNYTPPAVAFPQF